MGRGGGRAMIGRGLGDGLRGLKMRTGCTVMEMG